MPTDKRTLHTAHDTARLIADIKGKTLPIMVAIRDGVDRTSEQNRLVHRWFKDISNWLGDMSEADVKAQCNLEYGRPILARDDPEWEAAFGYVFDALNLPSKLKAIRVLDVPFTRRMGVKQLTEYMDQMGRDYREQGVPLCDPDMRGMEAMQR